MAFYEYTVYKFNDIDVGDVADIAALKSQNILFDPVRAACVCRPQHAPYMYNMCSGCNQLNEPQCRVFRARPRSFRVLPSSQDIASILPSCCRLQPLFASDFDGHGPGRVTFVRVVYCAARWRSCIVLCSSCFYIGILFDFEPLLPYDQSLRSYMHVSRSVIAFWYIQFAWRWNTAWVFRLRDLRRRRSPGSIRSWRIWMSRMPHCSLYYVHNRGCIDNAHFALVTKRNVYIAGKMRSVCMFS